MPKYFGAIAQIPEGTHFKDRKALAVAGIHAPLQAGIDGNSVEGAASIVLNGGYIDDYDEGEEIYYTGHGGNDPNTGRQTHDQSWHASGNKGLLISELHGLPVRVTRGYRHHSPWSPTSGYTYSGLYQVVEHAESQGKDGFMICRFKLRKMNGEAEPSTDSHFALPPGQTAPERLPTTTLRIVRDTKLAREIKKLYNYTCQICGLRITVKGVGYAEAAHIRPLGKPHQGQDQPHNILCLCPNHHVMLDKGIITIEDNLSTRGIAGRLSVKSHHQVGVENLRYHQTHIFINHED